MNGGGICGRGVIAELLPPCWSGLRIASAGDVSPPIPTIDWLLCWAINIQCIGVWLVAIHGIQYSHYRGRKG